jgi:hypothetical protein
MIVIYFSCRALLVFRRTNYEHKLTESESDPEKEKLLSSASTLNQNGIVPVYGNPIASVNRQ